MMKKGDSIVKVKGLTRPVISKWLCENVEGFLDAGFETVEDLEEVIESLIHHRTRRPVAPPPRRIRALRSGRTVKVPKPTIVIDSREHQGYSFEDYRLWIAGVTRKTLKVGDYSVEGMESEIAIERKSLGDAVTSVMPPARSRFLENCAKLSRLKRKAIEIEASLKTVKTGPYEVVDSQAHPNAVVGSYLAIQERWNIPIIFADTAELAEEWTAHVLTKYYTLGWLQENGFGGWYVDGDI